MLILSTTNKRGGGRSNPMSKSVCAALANDFPQEMTSADLDKYNVLSLLWRITQNITEHDKQSENYHNQCSNPAIPCVIIKLAKKLSPLYLIEKIRRLDKRKVMLKFAQHTWYFSFNSHNYLINRLSNIYTIYKWFQFGKTWKNYWPLQSGNHKHGTSISI